MTAAESAAWIRWVRTWDLDWFATPSFRYPVTRHEALRAVERWLAPLPGAYAAVSTQLGLRGGRLHVHALVGGTGRHPLRETLLRGTWRRGNLHLVGYSPRRGAVEYFVRQAEVIEIIGDPDPYQPHRVQRHSAHPSA